MQDADSSSYFESFVNPFYLNSTSAPLYNFNSSATTRSFIDHAFFDNSYENCWNGLSQQDYLYSISDVVNSTNLTFRLDFNATVFYLGTDFSNSSEYVVSCSTPTGVLP
jgi:hypothetical protein